MPRDIDYSALGITQSFRFSSRQKSPTSWVPAILLSYDRWYLPFGTRFLAAVLVTLSVLPLITPSSMGP